MEAIISSVVSSSRDNLPSPMDPDAFKDVTGSNVEDANGGDSESSVSNLPFENQATTKTCSCCRIALPVDHFNKSKDSKDGLQYYCRSCNTQAYLRHIGRKRPLGLDNDVPPETPEDVSDNLMMVEELTPDSLYIIENPRLPGEIKIGRSHNPEARARQLSAGQNFRLVVKRSYGEKGFLEKTLHHKLKRRRVDQGAGVEWFKVSVDQADILIKAAIVEDDLAKL